MNLFLPRAFSGVLVTLIGISLLSSCTVDQETSLTSARKASGSETKKKASSETSSWEEKMKLAREEREKARAEEAEEKEKELARAKKEEEEKDRKLAAQKKKEAAEKEAIALKNEREKAAREAAEEKAREQKLAEKKKELEVRLAARRKAEEERLARRESDRRREVAAVATREGGGGFFSRLAINTPSKYKSEGHHIHVNQRLLSTLNPSNAKIEIDISDQRARIYKQSGGTKSLVIETQVSTGKSGHTTPTGTYRIQEKKVEKRSTLYGSWVNSSGSTVRSSGESWSRPSGGSRFIGAEMPYWMRVTGGIGMHIGYVPNGPASHGCIRVPSAVQPLIYSKVGVGTSVTIRH
jgi:lipoprotein-anchoring transpeptidase ErfK/SrfK